MINRELRNYEVSLWTIQDDFMAVLKYADVEHKNQIQNPILTLDVDGTQSFNFSIPMYLYEGDTRVENSLWYDAYRGGLLLCGLRKIKVIINKGDKENEAIYEFLIMKVTENHQGGELTCDVECEGLAFQELGKTGYKVSLTSDDFYQDDLAWFENGGKYLDEQEISDFDSIPSDQKIFGTPSGLSGKWEINPKNVPQITLSWNEVNEANHYYLYHEGKEGHTTVLGGDTISSGITGLNANKTYRYAISAVCLFTIDSTEITSAEQEVSFLGSSFHYKKDGNGQLLVYYNNDFNNNTISFKKPDTLEELKEEEQKVALQLNYDHVFQDTQSQSTNLQILIESPHSAFITIEPDDDIAKSPDLFTTPTITKVTRGKKARNIFVYWNAVATALGYYIEVHEIDYENELLNPKKPTDEPQWGTYIEGIKDWRIIGPYRNSMTSATVEVSPNADYLIRIRAYNDTFLTTYTSPALAKSDGTTTVEFNSTVVNGNVYISNITRTGVYGDLAHDIIELHWLQLLANGTTYYIYYKEYESDKWNKLTETQQQGFYLSGNDTFKSDKAYEFYIAVNTNFLPKDANGNVLFSPRDKEITAADIIVRDPLFSAQYTGNFDYQLTLFAYNNEYDYYYNSYLKTDSRRGAAHLLQITENGTKGTASFQVTSVVRTPIVSVRAAKKGIISNKMIYSNYVDLELNTNEAIAYSGNLTPLKPELQKIENSTTAGKIKLTWNSVGTNKYKVQYTNDVKNAKSILTGETSNCDIEIDKTALFVRIRAYSIYAEAYTESDEYVINNTSFYKKPQTQYIIPTIDRKMIKYQESNSLARFVDTITITSDEQDESAGYLIGWKKYNTQQWTWFYKSKQDNPVNHLVLNETLEDDVNADLRETAFSGVPVDIAVLIPGYENFLPDDNIELKQQYITTLDVVPPGASPQITFKEVEGSDSSVLVKWKPATGATEYIFKQHWQSESSQTTHTWTWYPHDTQWQLNNIYAKNCTIEIIARCSSPISKKTVTSNAVTLRSCNPTEIEIDKKKALALFSMQAAPRNNTLITTTNSNESTDTATLQNRPKANLQYWCNKFLKPLPSDTAEMNPKEWYYEIKMDWTTFSKREGGSTRLSNIIYEDEYVSSWRIESNEAVPKDFQPCKEKERLVDLEESNKYNLTQDLAEKFGVYCKYQYLYDDTYHIIGRKIIFYNNFIEEDSGAMDITYKYNTTDLSRTIDSTDIVTKMYVRPVDNSYSLSGQATILDVGANLSHEDYLLNFDYLHDIGTIDDDLYNRVRPYEIEMCNYNQKIAPLQEALLELQTQLPQTQAQLQTAKNAVGLDTERITDAGALLNNLTNGSGIIHVTENNPDTAVILGGSSGYIKVSRKGIIPTTIQIYSTMNYASTGGNRLSGQISGGKMEYDEFGNLTKINGVTGSTERRIVYLTYDYQPQLYYENIKRTWEQRLSKDQGDVGKLTTEVNNLEENISSLEERIDTLITQKQEAINTFNRSMGSALREGYWQPNDYKDYGDRYVDNFSDLLAVKDKNQGFYGNSVFIWDDQPFPEEQTTSYALTVEETDTYYYYIELTWDIINKYKDQMGFLYYDYAVDGSKVGDSDTIRFRRAKMLGSESVLGFINKNKKAVPVLILLGYEQLGTYEQQYAASYGAVGRLETTVASNNSSIIFREDSTPVRSLGGIKQFSKDQKLIYPRIQFHSIALKTSEDQLNVRLDDTLLKNYEDFYILTRVDKNNSSSGDIGSDDFFTENFFLTIKPDKFAFGVAEQQQSNKTSVINVKYAFSNADTAIYLDAKEVLRDSSMPKVSYSVNVSLLQPVYMKRLAHLLNRIVHINDWELHFNNVQGYVSNVSLDLDHPWEDSIEIKNYRTKFEDLFTRIVASTESMKRAEFSTNIVSQVFNNEGEIHDASIVQSLIDSSALNYAFNNGQLTINEKDGIWGSSAEGVVAFRGGGIFTATEKDENGDWIWNSGILPKGINASLITAGQLDTNLINVYSGNNLRFQWNGDGLYAYKTPLYTNDSGVIIETVQDEYGREIDIEQNLQNSTSLGLDTKQYVVMNEDGLFLTLEAGAPYMKGGKITAMQKTVDRVAISWDGLVLCNNSGERVFYADPDTGDLTIKGRVEATSGYIGGFTIEEGSLWSGFSYENPDIRISANGLYIKNIIEASLGRFWAAGLMSYNASGYSSSSGSYVEVGSSTVIAETGQKVALDKDLLKGLKSYFQEVVTLTSLTQNPVNPDYNDSELTFKIGLAPSVISSESDENTPDPGLYLYDSSTSKWFPAAPLADAERKHAGLVLPGYTLIFHEAIINDQTVTNVLDVHLEGSQKYDSTRQGYTLGLHTQWDDTSKCVYLDGDINVHHLQTTSIQRSLNAFFTAYYNTVEAPDGLSSKVVALENIVKATGNNTLVKQSDLTNYVQNSVLNKTLEDYAKTADVRSVAISAAEGYYNDLSTQISELAATVASLLPPEDPDNPENT